MSLQKYIKELLDQDGVTKSDLVDFGNRALWKIPVEKVG